MSHEKGKPIVRLSENKPLQRKVAELVYEADRQRLMISSPELLAWNQLGQQEQEDFMKAIDMWLAGLGSNEVIESWYERSGHIIPTFLEDVALVDRVSWSFTALDVIYTLMGLARQSVEE